MAEGERTVGLASLTSPISVFGNQPGSFSNGKSVTSILTAGASSQIPNCPICTCVKVYRDGMRYLKDGDNVQRWLCTHCGLRFSDNPLKSGAALTSSRQICAEGAKNLHVLPCRKHVGTGEVTEEQKALLKVFEGWLRKEGYNKNCYPNNVKTLLHLKANLMDPEDVKAKIAAHKVKNGMKMQLCYSYEAFLKMQGIKWERPKGYKQDEVTPFIPEETELDQLIAAAHSRQMAAYLQTLKETFADPGEALAIEWRDIAGNIVNINHPVKDHKIGGLPVSNKLLAMLNILPHDSERVFSYSYSQVQMLSNCSNVVLLPELRTSALTISSCGHSDTGAERSLPKCQMVTC